MNVHTSPNPSSRVAVATASITAAIGLGSAWLLTRQQHHQAVLIQTVTPDAPAVVSSLGAMTVRLLEQGVSTGNAGLMALGQLNDRTKLVANVRSYDDCFLLYAALALLTLVPVLLVPKRRQHH